jgi:hypothetical protein
VLAEAIVRMVKHSEYPLTGYPVSGRVSSNTNR